MSGHQEQDLTGDVLEVVAFNLQSGKGARAGPVSHEEDERCEAFAILWSL